MLNRLEFAGNHDNGLITSQSLNVACTRASFSGSTFGCCFIQNDNRCILDSPSDGRWRSPPERLAPLTYLGIIAIRQWEDKVMTGRFLLAASITSSWLVSGLPNECYWHTGPQREDTLEDKLKNQAVIAVIPDIMPVQTLPWSTSQSGAMRLQSVVSFAWIQMVLDQQLLFFQNGEGNLVNDFHSQESTVSQLNWLLLGSISWPLMPIGWIATLYWPYQPTNQQYAGE